MRGPYAASQQPEPQGQEQLGGQQDGAAVAREVHDGLGLRCVDPCGGVKCVVAAGLVDEGSGLGSGVGVGGLRGLLPCTC